VCLLKLVGFFSLLIGQANFCFARYVKTVPLAAQMLDVRRHQKLQIIEELRIERGRFELEVEIGKSPPLSDNEVWWELRNKA
jgi:hypothetical protein